MVVTVVVIILVVIMIVWLLALTLNASNEELKDIIERADRGDEKATEELSQRFANGFTTKEHNAWRKKIYLSKANEGDPFAEYMMDC